MLKRLNDALPGLVIGILIYGLLVQLAGMWFVQDKLYYTIGLWYGIAIAVAMAIHLAAVIYDTATLYDENRASKMAVVKSVTRYAVVAVLFFLIAYFRFGNVVMAFVGVLGIKISAYLVLPVNNLLARIFPNRFTPSVGDDEELLAEYLAQQEAELQPTEEAVCDQTDVAEDTAYGTAGAIENIAGEASTNKTE